MGSSMTKYKVEFEIEAESADDVIRGIGGKFGGITKLNVEEAKPDNKYRTFGDVQIHVDDAAVADASKRGWQGGIVRGAGALDTPFPKG